MKFYTSNRLEELASQLTTVLDRPLHSPLAPEVVVVQSRGMARWLSLQIAQISKICMNFEFPFPRAIVGRTLRAYFPEMASEEMFTVEAMTWRINSLLTTLASKQEFGPVRNYLDKNDGLKGFQLSGKIAHLFDQYLVYRPDMLMNWERDEKEEHWQAILWRRLAGTESPLHLARMHELLGERMVLPPPENLLPERISIFGVSSLPPFYLRLFIELSRHCELNLFSLEPSQEYHGQDLTPKMKTKLLNSFFARGVVLSEDDLPSGNPLLTSLGKLNREFTEVRLDLDEQAGFVIEEQPAEFLESHQKKDILHSLQNDILHALSRGSLEDPKELVSADDGSVQIHACHSAMREMEILYDHLLERFEKDPTLKPRDIMVMTPDIEKYGPFIQVVFGYPEVDRRLIPFSVADRRPTSDSPTIEAFLAILAIPGSRCTALEIFSLLELTPIRRRFAFSDDELILIRRWITESGIRWGVDAAHRKTLQLPELETNTWRAGLKRLLLGYAMAGNNRTMFEGIMPFDEVEGDGAEVLGRLISALESIFAVAEALPADRALTEWPGALSVLIDQFFLAETNEEIADLRVIRQVLDQLHRTAAQLGSDQRVEFRVIRYHLRQLLDQGEQRGGFLTGAVTFCALQPMRSIPSRVICLIGMGDQDFPRQSRPPAFDLMAKKKQFGDRSVRDDDRYIFLEALLAARESLYISYVGRSAIDNEAIPPSVLVSELLDYLDQSSIFPGEKNSREWLVTDHRLHSFSPRYFDGKIDRLFSYSEANAAASRSLDALSSQRAPGFFGEPLPEPGEEARRVELLSLIEFFGNPAKYFIRRRLRLSLFEEDDVLEESEPFELNALKSYILKEELVAQALAAQRVTSDAYAARGVLPSGAMGLAHFQVLQSATEAFRERVEPELGGKQRNESLPVDMQIGRFRLTGRIEGIYDGRIVQYRCAALKGKDRVRAWINHVVRCASNPGAFEQTVLVGTDELMRWAPLQDAPEVLEMLLEIYWRGLRRALPFFPSSAFEYARAELSSSDKVSKPSLESASQIWHGSRQNRDGEKHDLYYDFCFSDGDPLDGEFKELAMQILEPMLRSADR